MHIAHLRSRDDLVVSTPCCISFDSAAQEVHCGTTLEALSLSCDKSFCLVDFFHLNFFLCFDFSRCLFFSSAALLSLVFLSVYFLSFDFLSGKLKGQSHLKRHVRYYHYQVKLANERCCLVGKRANFVVRNGSILKT